MIRAAALILALALAAAPRAAAPAEAPTDPAAAAALVADLTREAHATLADPALAAAARRARLEALVAADFALDVWRRFLLGDRAAALSEAETAAVADALPVFLAGLYARRFGGAGAPEPGEPRAGRRDVLAPVRLPRPGRGALPVEFRVRAIAGEPKVIDVLVNGVSFLLLERDAFAAALDRGGAPALLDYMTRRAGEGD